MKRLGIYALLIASIFVLSGMASALCDLNAILLNQNPYPATPGEYVKVVFQVNGTENPECGAVAFDLVPDYPFSLDSNATKTYAQGSNYIHGYSASLQIGYKVRVDDNAVDGDNKVQARFGSVKGDSEVYHLSDFYINVQDARTDFDLTIQDYDAVKNSITFGIINIGKYDAESLTLGIPEQDNLKLKGSPISIVGSLNSNDDTTASVEAVPQVGKIKVSINYNDQNDVRRTVEKEVQFTSNFLENGAVKIVRDKYFYMFWVLLVVFVIKAIWNWRQRRKAKNNKLNQIRR